MLYQTELTLPHNDTDERNTRDYISTFAGHLCVQAGKEEEARQKALHFGMLHLSETVTIPHDEAGKLTPADNAACEDGQFAVPVVGTMHFLGPSQAAVDARVKEILERVWKTEEVPEVRVGAFIVYSGPPNA